jgi:hypothetical protein
MNVIGWELIALIPALKFKKSGPKAAGERSNRSAEEFEPPRQLAVDQGLEAPQSRVTAAVLKFAAVASNRSLRW